MNLLKFKPIYEERIWGGRSFKTLFERIIPKGVRIGESLEICDSPKKSSLVSGGEFDGHTLRQLIEKYPSDVIGPGWNPKRFFPIIVKLLDARQRLSLQVHPNRASEKKYGLPRKNEAWYLLDCGVRSRFIAGLKPGVEPNDIKEAISAKNVEKLLEFRDSHVGDFMFVREGTVHSLGADNIALEIQENSDSTYRLYDWDRTDSDGKSRALHIAEAIDSVNFDNPTVEPLSENETPTRILCDYENFKIIRLRLKAGQSTTLPAREEPKIISLVSGKIDCSGICVEAVESALAPYGAEIKIRAVVDSAMLITENFARLG